VLARLYQSFAFAYIQTPSLQFFFSYNPSFLHCLLHIALLLKPILSIETSLTSNMPPKDAKVPKVKQPPPVEFGDVITTDITTQTRTTLVTWSQGLTTHAVAYYEDKYTNTTKGRARSTVM